MVDMKKPPASVTMDNIHEARRFPQQQDIASDNVLNLKEAAAVLHCHPKTLRLMARAHKIPAVRVGKLWRFSKERLRDWLEAS
jgi:excisionase family DNA binding protein